MGVGKTLCGFFVIKLGDDANFLGEGIFDGNVVDTMGFGKTRLVFLFLTNVIRQLSGDIFLEHNRQHDGFREGFPGLVDFEFSACTDSFKDVISQ